MLRKLIKHEFQATGRVMLPMYLILLVTAMGANLSTRGLLETDIWFLNFLGGALVTAFAMAMFAVCIVSFVLMVQRFQRNLLGDEGYLTLTLPVSIHKQVWAKLIVSAVWFALTLIVVFAACLIMAYDVGLIHQLVRGFEMVLEELARSPYAFDVPAFCLELLAVCFLGSCVLCLQFYAAMAAGHGFANHKKLWTVVMFFGLWFVMWWAVDGICSLFDFMGWDYLLSNLTEGWDMNVAMHFSMVTAGVLEVLYGSVAYVITVVCLKRRLNLE